MSDAYDALTARVEALRVAWRTPQGNPNLNPRFAEQHPDVHVPAPSPVAVRQLWDVAEDAVALIGLLVDEIDARAHGAERALRYLTEPDGQPRRSIDNPLDVGHAVIILRDVAGTGEGKRWWDNTVRSNDRLRSRANELRAVVEAAGLQVPEP